MKASGELHALTTLRKDGYDEWQDWSWSDSEHDA